MAKDAEGSVTLKHTYSVDIREPYMGNTVPLFVEVYTLGERVVLVEVCNPEGARASASHKITTSVGKLFNR